MRGVFNCESPTRLCRLISECKWKYSWTLGVIFKLAHTFSSLRDGVDYGHGVYTLVLLPHGVSRAPAHQPESLPASHGLQRGSTGDGSCDLGLLNDIAGDLVTLDLHYNLLEQFQRFADGRRSDYIMSPLVKQFGVDDKITLVTCYRAQARRNDYQRPEDPLLVIRGQGLYEKTCTNCHGSDSRGKQGYTYIAGQPIKYVARTLFHFREKTGGRTNPLMEAVASRLSSDDVDASSAFIFSLR